MPVCAHKTLALVFALLLCFSACGRRYADPEITDDAAFFGGNDPVAFKVRLAHSEILSAFTRLDEGLDPATACNVDLPKGICEDIDSSECSDLKALNRSVGLRAQSINFLSSLSTRLAIRKAITESRFEVVSSFSEVQRQPSAKHSVAIAPIGSTEEPIYYLGPALLEKKTLVPIVFHELGHVTGLTDEELHGGQAMHDILSAAGTCLLNFVHSGTPMTAQMPDALEGDFLAGGLSQLSSSLFSNYSAITHVVVVSFIPPPSCDVNVAGTLSASSGNRIALLGGSIPAGAPLDRYSVKASSSQQIVFQGGVDEKGNGTPFRVAFAASFADPIPDAFRMNSEASDACRGQWTPRRSDDATPWFLHPSGLFGGFLPNNGVVGISYDIAKR